MADDNDDLMSLDFTVPGAFEAPPEEPAAPEIPAPPAAPPAPVRPPMPAALEEAARMYAAGQELEAMRRLESAIKNGEDLGDAAVRAWGCLFELLQVLGRRPAFDALALTFARRFEKSPPTWSPVVDGPHVASESSGGRAHVSLSGMLDAGIGEVLKQTMKLAATSAMVRMDLAKLEDADNNGATLLMRALAALKRAKKEIVFGNPEHLAQILSAKLVPGERSNESMWLLLLELYQQAYRQDAFEEAAVNYAVTFEVSPPSWEALPPRAAEAPQASSANGPKSDEFVLRGQMLGANAAQFAPLDAALAGSEEFDIDAHNLVRIDAGSAAHLLDVLTRLHDSGKKLRIIGLSTLVAAYLETLGFADVAELRARVI
ncbi:putative sulfate transporter/antisigma-factor antagonist STAS [Sulfuritalea hydrogenivorans sk43H]|uniref:Putative sulfate transporter/antisigma-factor antagonist STAS n=2 Tax=Sulfuritalea hydrogenivorans TaxID=748811 RepID=W0SBK3_9PROT|nr:putative sulfate transporter/antisigma-factor antagonist STAS [Sulfuritalea hydrogenivorans sk43H]